MDWEEGQGYCGNCDKVPNKTNYIIIWYIRRIHFKLASDIIELNRPI